MQGIRMGTAVESQVTSASSHNSFCRSETYRSSRQILAKFRWNFQARTRAFCPRPAAGTQCDSPPNSSLKNNF